MTEELYYHTITELASLIESKEISPVEVTADILERIASVDGRLKAYATVMAEQAMGQARVAEREILAGDLPGSLAWRSRGGQGPLFHVRCAHDGRQCGLCRPRSGFRLHSSTPFQ